MFSGPSYSIKLPHYRRTCDKAVHVRVITSHHTVSCRDGLSGADKGGPTRVTIHDPQW